MQLKNQVHHPFKFISIPSPACKLPHPVLCTRRNFSESLCLSAAAREENSTLRDETQGKLYFTQQMDREGPLRIKTKEI